MSQSSIRDVVTVPKAEVGKRKIAEVSQSSICDVVAVAKTEVGERKITKVT